MYGYVYKTQNIINGKIYIGQHKGSFTKDYPGSGLLIRRAIKKDGIHNFKTEAICYLPSKHQINEFEKYLISKYREILGEDRVYNIAEGGYKPLNQSMKNKISKTLKERFKTVPPAFKNQKHTNATKKKMRDNQPIKTGELNPNWRGGVSNPKCCDCGKSIYYSFKRCKSCVGKLRSKDQFISMAKKRGAPWNKGLKK